MLGAWGLFSHARRRGGRRIPPKQPQKLNILFGKSSGKPTSEFSSCPFSREEPARIAEIADDDAAMTLGILLMILERCFRLLWGRFGSRFGRFGDGRGAIWG